MNVTNTRLHGSETSLPVRTVTFFLGSFSFVGVLFCLENYFRERRFGFFFADQTLLLEIDSILWKWLSWKRTCQHSDGASGQASNGEESTRLGRWGWASLWRWKKMITRSGGHFAKKHLKPGALTQGKVKRWDLQMGAFWAENAPVTHLQTKNITPPWRHHPPATALNLEKSITQCSEFHCKTQ